MALVDYSDSEEEIEHEGPQAAQNSLPPLPATFRDLYSSTVRASIQDDPSLHAGRKRVTPHVVGHWPTHVYLEWCPSLEEYPLLSRIVDDVRASINKASQQESTAVKAQNDVQSLLTNDLGVQLPLHVSLSRPLALKTEQKDLFLRETQAALDTTYIRAFSVSPLSLVWHSNEDRTRWFLVIRVRRPDGDELRKLLELCNNVAAKCGQPLLYNNNGDLSTSNESGISAAPHDSFHVSIAWSLYTHSEEGLDKMSSSQQAVDPTLQSSLEKLRITFSELKVRIGQDVSSLPLQKRKISGFA